MSMAAFRQRWSAWGRPLLPLLLPLPSLPLQLLRERPPPRGEGASSASLPLLFLDEQEKRTNRFFFFWLDWSRE